MKRHEKRHPIRNIKTSPITHEPRSSTKRKRPQRDFLTEPLPQLSSKEIKEIRGKAHSLKPLVLVGEKGITDEVVKALWQVFYNHDIVKVKMRDPEDKRAMAEDLAERANALLAGLTGHTVILYKPFPPGE